LDDISGILFHHLPHTALLARSMFSSFAEVNGNPQKCFAIDIRTAITEAFMPLVNPSFYSFIFAMPLFKHSGYM
jgi:hypothetical protein